MELYLTREELSREVIKLFPSFKNTELLEELLDEAVYKELDPGEVLLNLGDYIKHVPLVLDGLIQVSRRDHEGHELLLYYVNRGETCAMSLTCCMAMEQSSVRAEVIEPASILMLPIEKLDYWMMHYPEWKNFIMQTYQRRFDELLVVIDNIAFKRMDERILEYLRNKVDVLKSDSIEITHQRIADDLNSSREVISRILKKMEQKDMITLARNMITLHKD